ncbi:MAG TPA: DUF948 domain-containing protein [Candidatus Dormibacteraeota bacterium]|nr:DUF948 domain-containing protein [Candidatus Dormibacteraeota bacterium]
MQLWLEIFSIVAALALVVQVVILTVLLFQMRRTTDNVNRLVGELQSRMGPILTRVQILLDDTQPKISSMVNDASHMVYLARGQAQKVDRVFTEAADRLRGQIMHADHILTGVLESAEEVGSQVKHGFWRPVQKVSALVQGIKVGLDLLRSRRRGSVGHADRRRGDEPRETQEEELFI